MKSFIARFSYFSPRVLRFPEFQTARKFHSGVFRFIHFLRFSFAGFHFVSFAAQVLCTFALYIPLH